MTAAGGERRPGGLRRLAERVAAVPDAVLRAASMPGPEVALDPLAVRCFQATGLGSSAAHAKYLAHLLAAGLGLPARFVPASAFVGRPPRGSRADALVVFSQGLSPNARFALSRPRAWRHLIVMTAVREDGGARGGAAGRLAALREAGALVLPMPGEDEYGTLLRVLGPAAGYVRALRFAQALAARMGAEAPALDLDSEALAGRLRRAPERLDAALRAAGLAAPGALDLLRDPVSLLAGGDYGGLLDNLSLKLSEGLYLPAPPVHDLLGFAHGPFQSIFERRATLIALTRPGAPREADLLDSLRAMLERDRHRLLRLEATLPGPLAVLEHETLLNELVLRTIEAAGIDPSRWPGRGREGRLYALAPEDPEPPEGRPS